MRKWWYQRILVIILVLAMTMGTGFGVQQLEASEEKQIVSSKGSNAQYVIPGGMAIGIYMEKMPLYLYLKHFLWFRRQILKVHCYTFRIKYKNLSS